MVKKNMLDISLNVILCLDLCWVNVPVRSFAPNPNIEKDTAASIQIKDWMKKKMVMMQRKKKNVTG